MRVILSVLISTAIFTFIFYFATEGYLTDGLAWFDFVIFTLILTSVILAISPNHQVGRGRGMVSIANRNKIDNETAIKRSTAVLWITLAILFLFSIFLILRIRF